MSTVPTEREQAELDKMARAGSAHFILLVVLIGVGGITFLLPEDIAPLAIVGVAILLTLAGVSSVNLQYFQKCPRCKVRIARTQGSCGQCGLEYYAARKK
jgi:hypothetical protein